MRAEEDVTKREILWGGRERGEMKAHLGRLCPVQALQAPDDRYIPAMNSDGVIT